jgi:hypothetical protein
MPIATAAGSITRRLVFALTLALCLLPVARATTVIPPSFRELVNDADAIYRGTVASIEARRVERADGQGATIKTFVTFSIQRTLKGPAKSEVTLEFLGGTVGDDTLAVQGMPKFKVGDREFVFVQKNGIQFCPLVAMMHGRYRELRDGSSGKDYVARDNRTPLTDIAEVGLPMTALPPSVRAATASESITRALTPAAFESQISAELDRLEQRANPN